MKKIRKNGAFYLPWYQCALYLCISFSVDRLIRGRRVYRTKIWNKRITVLYKKLYRPLRLLRGRPYLRIGRKYKRFVSKRRISRRKRRFVRRRRHNKRVKRRNRRRTRRLRRRNRRRRRIRRKTSRRR